MKDPGCPNSNRIRTLKEVPTMAAQTPKIKYKVPISLWLVENNQRFIITRLPCGQKNENNKKK
jgi:hypothetical protein